jgi:uncharacterized membrane protein YfcA
MTALAAIGLGLLIGLSLGALGGGGSILTVPVLVYALGQSTGAATTGSLVIVGITAIVAAVSHTRARHVRWGAGTAFGLAGVASSYAGTALNRQMNPDALLLAFAALIVVAATAMLRRSSARAQRVVRTEPLVAAVTAAPASRVGGTAGRPLPGTGHPAGSTGRTSDASRGSPHAAVKIILAGLVVGFLTGTFGVGGGFVIVPALVMALGYDMPVAVGTSLLVIAINSAAALLARAGNETFHWSVIIPFTLAAIASSVVGKSVAAKVPATLLTRAFVALLFAVAAYVAIRSGIGLAAGETRR